MSDITAAAEEAVAIARGEQAANRVYINGVFYVPEEKYAAVTARVEELEGALEEVMKWSKPHDKVHIIARAAITKGERTPSFGDFVEGCDYLPVPSTKGESQ